MGFRMNVTTNKFRKILFEWLHYDPDTGVFTWLKSRGSRACAGTRAGRQRPDGYRTIKFAGKDYLEQRLAVLYMTGAWPTDLIDHKSRRPSDNRWENLRPATYSQNHANRCVRVDSASGVKGVYRRKSGRWFAQVGWKRLGGFDSCELASAAVAAEALRVYGEFACP